MFSSKHLKIFKNTFFTEHLGATASERSFDQLSFFKIADWWYYLFIDVT